MNDLLHSLSELPLYMQWNLGLLGGSYMLCLFLLGLGMICQLFRRSAQQLPPLSASDFPNGWDTLYTFFFLAAFSSLSITEIDAGGASENRLQGFSYGAVLIQILIYLPMLLRYLSLPRAERVASKKSEIIGIGVVVFGTLAIGGIYEHSGVFQWLLKASGSPMYQDTVQYMHDQELSSTLPLIIMAVVAAPFCEECCFRGFLYGILRKRIGRWAAAGASALLFGAVHMALGQMLPLVIFALLQCILYEKTRSLRAPIIAHMLFNLLGTLGAIFFYSEP